MNGQRSLYKINQTTVDDYTSDNESLMKKNRKSNMNVSGLGGGHPSNIDMSFNNNNTTNNNGNL